MDDPKRKKRKMEPYTKKWEKLANEIARAYGPIIYPCNDCGCPVISGHCCIFCKSQNP